MHSAHILCLAPCMQHAMHACTHVHTSTLYFAVQRAQNLESSHDFAHIYIVISGSYAHMDIHSQKHVYVCVCMCVCMYTFKCACKVSVSHQMYMCLGSCFLSHSYIRRSISELQNVRACVCVCVCVCARIAYTYTDTLQCTYCIHIHRHIAYVVLCVCVCVLSQCV
jgi:hypothetical protein